MRLPASPSRSVLMIGMPPPTAASNDSARLVRLGELRERHAMVASSALLAVTTGLPASSAASTAALGGIALAAHQLDEDVDAADRARARPGRRPSAAVERSSVASRGAVAATQTATSSIGRPARSASASRVRTISRDDGRADRAQSGKADSAAVRPCGGSGRTRESAQPRLASGTTLCNFSGRFQGSGRMLRAAWRMRCSFSTSAMRT